MNQRLYLKNGECINWNGNLDKNGVKGMLN